METITKIERSNFLEWNSRKTFKLSDEDMILTFKSIKGESTLRIPYRDIDPNLVDYKIAYEPSSLLLPYAASKGALVALTKGLAEELIEKGIRVNAVAPGPIWSPLNTHGSPEEKLKKFGENSAFGRPGQPSEVAPVFVLLASDEASYITGEIYGITGGRGIA